MTPDLAYPECEVESLHTKYCREFSASGGFSGTRVGNWGDKQLLLQTLDDSFIIIGGFKKTKLS